MISLILRKSRMIHDESGLGSLICELESDDRVDPRVPSRAAPGLDYPLVWEQLNVSTDNVASETREWTSRFAADFCRLSGERAEILRADQRFVDAIRARSYDDLMMDGWRHGRPTVGTIFNLLWIFGEFELVEPPQKLVYIWYAGTDSLG